MESSNDYRNSGVVFAPRCVSIDLEVSPKTSQIKEFGAVRGDSGKAYHFVGGDLKSALERLDVFSRGAAFTLGHNIVAFDIPYLRAANPDLDFLKLPAVDTLRLNPLAFPRNPYHRLVKHYQEGQLVRGRINDPELDARLTLEVFGNQRTALAELNTQNPDLVLAWHWLTTVNKDVSGLNSFFTTLRHRACPTKAEAHAAIRRLFEDTGCPNAAQSLTENAESAGWALAYALAWLSVSGGNSVVPPWVRNQFPETGRIIKRLRDTACNDSNCNWCQVQHNAVQQLKRWFNFDSFRPDPKAEDGRPLQQVIVEAAMRCEHVLGILPTGTGKSVCYQIPALSRYEKTGALTVVISPLVALMADQVAGLEKFGITSAAAINGLLSMPERADVLDRTRLGDVSIVIMSPEQLRSTSVRKVLAQREIGLWVLDEAHCLSKWGHDFRPDYRYVGRFIKKMAGDAEIPPILCLTATAKPDVIEDIQVYFNEKLQIQLREFNGGTSRTNLEFEVLPTTSMEKFESVAQLLVSQLAKDTRDGAIVYCSSRKRTEVIATFLKQKGYEADYFHAGLTGERKKSVQDDFIRGDLKVIAATNAFGMGIDKSDVRLVIHADIPGSLENYIQEAGRAGRDRKPARCVLLYTPEDVERQFGLSARSRLNPHEIQSILKSLRSLDRKKKSNGEVIATTGEILRSEEEGEFERDKNTDDTRVRTAISWLEESTLLTREENQVHIFPSSLHISNLQDADARLVEAKTQDAYRLQLRNIVSALFSAKADQGISTDELMEISGLDASGIRRALYDLENLGICSNDTALTAFVNIGGVSASRKRLEDASALESALIAQMREEAPDLGSGNSSTLNLRHAAHLLKQNSHTSVNPTILWKILKGLAAKIDKEGSSSLTLRRIDQETALIKLQSEWSAIDRTADLKRKAAACLLEHLLSTLPTGSRGNDLLAETTLGKLTGALTSDTTLYDFIKDAPKLLDYALLWLHEQEVIRLNKGMAVFRAAMTIKLNTDRRNFLKADYEPLKIHYDQQTIQIHIMSEYAERGLQQTLQAVELSGDYFALSQEEFNKKWLPKKQGELSRQTTPTSWKNIVESLRNKSQQKIVTDDRSDTNVLILAGPGSGKTRVLVHRIAWLVRVRRENPRGIVALAYNHHAAIEIRKRLRELIEEDAHGVTVLTLHGLAMRLTGFSFKDSKRQPDSNAFNEIIRSAVDLLKGEGVPPEDFDEHRDRLLAGFRWILVDEYQDIGVDQYDLISALAGRTSNDEDGKLNLFAVGDDDQNIYGFNGTSVEFIRRFEADYLSKPSFLIENYRSTKNIIAASNKMIEVAGNRMKVENPIVINSERKDEQPGGTWEKLDAVARGRVQLLGAGRTSISQAVAVMSELKRLQSLDAGWCWDSVAVIAQRWDTLAPVRSYCELHKIPVQIGHEDPPSFWALRETQSMISWVKAVDTGLIKSSALKAWLDGQPDGAWWALVREAVYAYSLEVADSELPGGHFLNWLAEWGREIRRKQRGILLVTAHSAKGLEFDHVVVLDGEWDSKKSLEDIDASRRLYYVAMTRAKRQLILARQQHGTQLTNVLVDADSCFVREIISDYLIDIPELRRKYETLSMKDVDLGYPGRIRSNDKIHVAIRNLNTGDPITLDFIDDAWVLKDATNTVIGKLAKSYRPPAAHKFIAGRITAILVRTKEDSAPEYQAQLKSDRWEVAIPELVFQG